MQYTTDSYLMVRSDAGNQASINDSIGEGKDFSTEYAPLMCLVEYTPPDVYARPRNGRGDETIR